MAHVYGYARVSTTAQNLDAQVDELTGAGGVDERYVVVEKASGRREDRPELARLLAGLREGDTLVVTKLDRLGRSAAHVARLVRDLDESGVTLRTGTLMLTAASSSTSVKGQAGPAAQVRRTPVRLGSRGAQVPLGDRGVETGVCSNVADEINGRALVDD